ncbi:hypothetical protein E0H75_42325 [Kribbella capetownensis]|uniref:DUF8175 domain-containing protein n=1 Tax=Kribbella capetownensis TaxID=1572659 RepID=A0A4R0IR14_9ACTN|nr:hypothetical protein [Kribbella capetownensis]TCC33896.1 hypothetical protein E0H75_42325 [Kribbella capetownensis]
MSSRITPPGADNDSTSRRRWTLVLAGLVLVVVVVGAILLLVNRDDQPEATPPPSQPTDTTSTSTPTEQPSATTSGPQTCDLPAGSQTIPSTPIHGANWDLVNRYAVPSAEKFGPQITDPDSLRRCFAHSPVGSVFAAYNFFAAMSPPDDPTGAKTFPILRRIMTTGPDLDSYIQLLKNMDDTGSGGGGVQLVGFKVLDATTDRVTMLLAAEANGGYASSTWTLVWQGDDWKVVAPQPGEKAGDPYTTLQDLTGFVPWRGA